MTANTSLGFTDLSLIDFEKYNDSEISFLKKFGRWSEQLIHGEVETATYYQESFKSLMNGLPPKHGQFSNSIFSSKLPVEVSTWKKFW